jgi:hypothetical protein
MGLERKAEIVEGFYSFGTAYAVSPLSRDVCSVGGIYAE